MSRQYSDEFRDAFDSGMGHCQMTCACGRIHFDASPEGFWTWEEGEFEGLCAKSEAFPDKCVAHQGTIGAIEIYGSPVVMGCICDTAAYHERFIEAHARQIATYLNARAKRIKAEASRVHDAETVAVPA